MTPFYTLIVALSLGQTAATAIEAPQAAIVRMTNEFRQSNRMGAINSSKKLMEIAQAHADNMARQDKYGDSDRNGHVLDRKDMKDRLMYGGYKYRAAGENVAMSQGMSDPVGVAMDGWRKSSGHRANMLGKDYTEMGAGVAQSKSGKWYFVQVFGKPAE